MHLALVFTVAAAEQGRDLRRHVARQPTLSVRGKVGAALFSAGTFAAANGAYMAVASLPQLRYFQWANTTRAALIDRSENGYSCDEKKIDEDIRNGSLSIFSAAPDFFLDLFKNKKTAWNRANAISAIADLVPALLMIAGPLMALIAQDFLLFNRVFFVMSFLILNNAIVENLTVFPPTYGLARCLEFNNDYDPTGGATSSDVPTTIAGALARAVNAVFGINLTGTCTAMVWSGHTVHTMTGLWGVLQGLQALLPARLRPRNWAPGGYNTWTIHALVLLAGAGEAILLLLNFAHYGADVWIGGMLAFFVTQSNDLAYLATRMNPFLREMEIRSSPISV